jgi:hypothetical protein
VATLTDLQDYVRTQTETTSAELPNSTINTYLQEAFNRTIAAETMWPFFETIWTITQTAGQTYMSKPTDLDVISSLIDTDNYDYRLTMIDYDLAEDEYFRSMSTGSYPVEYSIWGELIYLWPQTEFADDRAYRMRGYRTPTDWIGTSSPPDCDTRLHLPLCHYAIALAYAQQEAEGLEDQSMKRWQADVELARQAIMEPNPHRPLIMGPRRFSGIGRNRFRPTFTIDVS